MREMLQILAILLLGFGLGHIEGSEDAAKLRSQVQVLQDDVKRCER